MVYIKRHRLRILMAVVQNSNMSRSIKTIKFNNPISISLGAIDCIYLFSISSLLIVNFSLYY